MAKLTYEIPTSLDASYLDMEVVLATKEGVGFQAVPLRVILLSLASALFLFYMLLKTFIGKGGALIVVSFVIFWFLMTALLVKYDESRRMGIQLIAPLSGYTKANRQVHTRRTDDAMALYFILGIRDIELDGRILFSDGSYGYCCRVVGTASILLFDDDKRAILDRVDNYYRKMDVDVEHIYLTTKEPQQIHNQLVALSDRYKHLATKDADLVHLIQEQEETLTDYVGGRFRTIHQYAIVKGKNEEALDAGMAALSVEAESSAMMFRQVSSMQKEETLHLLKEIFS